MTEQQIWQTIKLQLIKNNNTKYIQNFITNFLKQQNKLLAHDILQDLSEIEETNVFIRPQIVKWQQILTEKSTRNFQRRLVRGSILGGAIVQKETFKSKTKENSPPNSENLSGFISSKDKFVNPFLKLDSKALITELVSIDADFIEQINPCDLWYKDHKVKEEAEAASLSPLQPPPPRSYALEMERQNAVINWVNSEVLFAHRKDDERTKVVKKFLEMIHMAEEMGAINTVVQIVNGLNKVDSKRLMSPALVKEIDLLDLEYNTVGETFREKMRQAPSSITPFIGNIYTQIQQLDVLHSDKIGEWINVYKLEALAEILQAGLLRFKGTEMPIATNNEDAKQYLLSRKEIPMDKAYDASLLIKSRGQ